MLLVSMASNLADVAETHQIRAHQCRVLRILQISDVLILAKLIFPSTLGICVGSRPTVLAIGGLQHEHVSGFRVGVRRHFVLLPILLSKFLACGHGDVMVVKAFDDVSSSIANELTHTSGVHSKSGVGVWRDPVFGP